MNKEIIAEGISEIFAASPENTITENPIDDSVAGLVMFDAPIFGIGSAADPLFDTYKKVGVIGPWHMSPNEWLPEAKSIVSLFFPFSERVKADNRKYTDRPSPAWLHGRIEGQAFIHAYMRRLGKWFAKQGAKYCIPASDSRFLQIDSHNNTALDGYPMSDVHTYGSNWSERHAAFVCGLGTFGLSKGLITVRGIAGRYASIILDVDLPADTRPYNDIYEYCIKCGRCAERCPAHAISLETGKNHIKCSEYCTEMAKQFLPRYGCGLCQTDVPCESRNPN